MLPTGPRARPSQTPGLPAYEQPDRVPPGPDVPTPVARPRVRGPILAPRRSVLVAVLAGGALFMSGFLVGQRGADQPGTPGGRADSFQPFWDTYHTISSRYAGGEIDQQALVRGAIQGMVEALGDPYSAYLTPEEYQTGPPGPVRPVRGHRRRDRDRRRERRDERLHDARARLHPHRRRARSRARRPRRPGLQAGDAIVAVDGAALDGLTVDGARDKVRGKKGTEVVLTIKRGEDAAVRRHDRPRRHRPARRSSTRTSPAARSATSG